METPKKPVKKTTPKTAGAKKQALKPAPKPKKRFDDEDEDEDYIMPIEDMDYDSLQDFDDED